MGDGPSARTAPGGGGRRRWPEGAVRPHRCRQVSGVLEHRFQRRSRKDFLLVGLHCRSLSHARHPAVVVVVVDDDSPSTAPPTLGSRVPPAPAPASRSPGPSRDQVVRYMPPDLIHTDTCICMYHVNNNPARDTIGETKKARERKQVSPEVAEWSTGLAEQARRLPPLRRHPDQQRRTLPLARGDHAGPWTLAPPPRRKEKKRWHAGRGLDWTRRRDRAAAPRPAPPARGRPALGYPTNTTAPPGVNRKRGSTTSPRATATAR